MLRAVLAVVRHELRLQTRQAQSLLLFLTLAVGAGPLGLVAMDRWMAVTEQSAERSAKTAPIQLSADPPIPSWLVEDDNLEIVPGPVTSDDLLEGGESYGHARIEGDEVVLTRPFAVTRSNMLEGRLVRAVRRSNVDRVKAAVVASGEPWEPPLALRWRRETRDEDARAGEMAGRSLPAMLFFLLLSMAMYAAVDVITKEKEKGTAETLLVVAIDRRALLLGKALVVFGLTALVGATWVLGLAASEGLGVLRVPNLFEGAVFTAANTGVLLMGAVLASLQVSAAALVVASLAPSFRAASILSMPFVIALMAPVGFASVPTVELGPSTLWLPVSNVVLAVRSLMAGELTAGLGAATLGVVVAQTAATLGLAGWILSEVDPFDKGLDAEARRGTGDFGPDAFVLFAVAMLGFWFFGTVMQKADPVLGLIGSLGTLLPLAALLGPVYVGAPLRETLSLRAPSGRDLGLGAAMGLTVHGVGLLVAAVMQPFLQTPDAVAQGILDLADTPLPLLLFAGAVMPGVCEELLFRGALLGLLRSRYSVVVSVAVSSVMFGFMHLDLGRIVVTAAMGVAFGALVVRTRSIVPGMVAHTLNNALFFGLASAGVATDGLGVGLVVWALCATIATGGLVSLAGRGRPGIRMEEGGRP